MNGEDEKILNREQWKLEAAAVIQDIKPHVRSACISDLEGTDEFIFLNFTTLEGSDFCVKMSKDGFSVSDKRHNSSALKNEQIFETPYALLDKVSPKYRESFANQLMIRLTALQKSEADDQAK